MVWQHYVEQVAEIRTQLGSSTSTMHPMTGSEVEQTDSISPIKPMIRTTELQNSKRSMP